MLLYLSQIVLTQVAEVSALAPRGILELLALGGGTGGSGIAAYIVYDFIKTKRNGRRGKADPTAEALKEVAKSFQKSTRIQDHMLDRMTEFDTRQQIMARDIGELVEHARK